MWFFLIQQDKSFIYLLLYINYIKKTNYGWIFFWRFVQNSNILWGGAYIWVRKRKTIKIITIQITKIIIMKDKIIITNKMLKRQLENNSDCLFKFYYAIVRAKRRSCIGKSTCALISSISLTHAYLILFQIFYLLHHLILAQYILYHLIFHQYMLYKFLHLDVLSLIFQFLLVQI